MFGVTLLFPGVRGYRLLSNKRASIEEVRSIQNVKGDGDEIPSVNLACDTKRFGDVSVDADARRE